MIKKTYKKSIKIHLPKGIIETLDSSLNKNIPTFDYDKYIFIGILYDIASNRADNKIYDNDELPGAPLYSKYLENKYGKSYYSYVNYLVCHNIIVLVHDADRDKHEARRYELNNTLFCIDKTVLMTVEIPNDSTLGKYFLKKHNHRNRKAERYPIYVKSMRNHFLDNLKIDKDKAVQFVLNNVKTDRKKVHKLLSIEKIHLGTTNKQLYYNRNDNNYRIDSNLSNLSKELKQFLICDEPLYQLDLTNSHPVLFNIYLLHIKSNILSKGNNRKVDSVTTPSINNNIQLLKSIDISKIKIDRKCYTDTINEIDKYYELTTTGKWYEYLGKFFYGNETIHLTDTAIRDFAKKNWMAIAYCHNRTTNYKFQKAMFDLFALPRIGSIIHQIKRKDYANFAITLQRIEAELFIDNICKRLVNENIIPFTIHDSVIVKKSQLSKTKQIMKAELRRYLGVLPKLKTEPLNNIIKCNNGLKSA